MIKIRGLHKSFAANPVLRGVDLDILAGQTTTVIGGSGSGKSVLFKHIIGLMKPDAGSVLVDGVNMSALRERELYGVIARFGMVFQGGALFDSMTVGENVAFGVPGRAGMTAAAIQELIDHSLSQVGLSGISQLMPAELSGGMKKRVAIARAIAKRPAILMFDEPTTGLDPIDGRRHQRPHHQSQRRPRDHFGRHHPQHGQRLQDIRQDRGPVRRPHHRDRFSGGDSRHDQRHRPPIHRGSGHGPHPYGVSI